VFFKSKSDKLLLYRLYNHKIKLKGDNTLKYSLLYKITTAELKTVKKYLINNLDKGFIKASQALYVAPVFFVKKLDRSLRFCIDFRKLNQITCKDRYLLLLINKTLAWISQAKIFIKLDIWQAFYRI
jgi:hypothetical protein